MCMDGNEEGSVVEDCLGRAESSAVVEDCLGRAESSAKMAGDGLIDPQSFDVIVLGTGLQEALLAAAAAASRLTVLHLDPHDFYGAHWSSLDIKQIASWAEAGGCFSVPPVSISSSADAVDELARDDSSPNSRGASSESGLEHGNPICAGREVDPGDSQQPGAEAVENGTTPIEDLSHGEKESASVAGGGDLGLEAIELESGKSFFSGVEVCEHEGGSPLGPPRSYSIDLSGPRLTFCGSSLVDWLLRSGARHYVEFKGIDASFIWTGTGGISAVPSSRADVFKDKSLSLPHKRHLMRFFKLVTDYAVSADQSRSSLKEDLDIPFRDFLQRERLPASIQSIIFYAIALVDDDQAEDSGALLKTRDGLQKLALYLSSVARFPNAPGPFLYPLYGQGELPQAFCRSAAVNGALYVLRRPASALLVDRDSKEVRGIRTLQGQVLYSKTLIMGPSLTPKSGHGGNRSAVAGQSTESSSGSSASSSEERPKSQVARCVCITDRSISEGLSTLLVIFPPRSVHERCTKAIRALQVSTDASVCPDGQYVVQLSTMCTDSADGRGGLEAAVDSLFSRGPQNVEGDSEMYESSKPKVLWSVFYVQALHTTAENLAIPGLTICSLPDGTLDGEQLLASTEMLFKGLFPKKDLFPKVAAAPEDQTDDEDEA